MRTRHKLVLASLVLAAAFSVAVGTANARNFRINEPNFEDIWERLNFTAAGTTVGCPVTLLGHFEERTFPKIVNSIIGTYRHYTVGTCTGGTVTILNETLPWRFSYRGFQGILPIVGAIRFLILGLSLRVHPTGSSECLFGTTTTHPGFAEATRESGGNITGYRVDERIGIPLNGGFLCELAGEATIEGTAEVRNLPRLGVLNLFLI